MDDLSTPKLNKRNDKRRYNTSIIAAKKTQVGYDANLGLWGQPRSFYGGLAAGSLFIVLVFNLLLNFLSRI